jgi:hypothetical protein
MSTRWTSIARSLTRAVSRREFVGRFVRLASATAMGFGGLLAAQSARAAPPIRLCCVYASKKVPGRTFVCVNGNNGGCPKPQRGEALIKVTTVNNCNACK